MRNTIRALFAGVVLATFFPTPPVAAQGSIFVVCDPGPGCPATLVPPGVVIPFGGNVTFTVSASCGVAPCPAVHPGPPPGAFLVTVPPGPGFAGLGPVVVPPAGFVTTPAFAAAGVFPFTVVGSTLSGTIMVGPEAPALSPWAVVAFVVLLASVGLIVIRRRIRA